MTNVIRDLFTLDEWEILCSLDSSLCKSLEDFPQELTEEKERIYEIDQ